MNTESKNKWQIRLATMSIFLFGFIAGAIALNAYHLWFGAANQPSKRERFKETINQLNLDDAQKAEVQKIIGETREKIHNHRQESEPRMQEIRNQTDERMRKVLTPEQWQKFQQLQEEMRKSDKKNSSPKEK